MLTSTFPNFIVFIFRQYIFKLMVEWNVPACLTFLYPPWIRLTMFIIVWAWTYATVIAKKRHVFTEQQNIISLRLYFKLSPTKSSDLWNRGTWPRELQWKWFLIDPSNVRIHRRSPEQYVFHTTTSCDSSISRHSEDFLCLQAIFKPFLVHDVDFHSG